MTSTMKSEPGALCMRAAAAGRRVSMATRVAEGSVAAGARSARAVTPAAALPLDAAAIPAPAAAPARNARRPTPRFEFAVIASSRSTFILRLEFGFDALDGRLIQRRGKSRKLAGLSLQWNHRRFAQSRAELAGSGRRGKLDQAKKRVSDT